MIAPKPIPLTTSSRAALSQHLYTRVTALKDSLRTLHETKLPAWRRMYEGRPLENSRNFPFQNASNLVVPLIGIHSDTMQARIMAAIWKVRPVFPVKLYGRYDAVSMEQIDEIKEAWEEFLIFNAVEPDELDLYRVEEEWFGEICRYGTSTVKIANEDRFVDMWVPSGDGSTGDIVSENVYSGPRPQKIAFEDFLIPVDIARPEDADIKVHRVRLKKHQLMERRFRGVYEPAQVDKIINSPDRTSPAPVTSQRLADAGLHTTSLDFAEWDVYECWLAWRAPNQKMAPRVIVWYHLASNTILRAIYDFYPDQPFVTGRLLYRDDSVYGYGFCEIIGDLQEEISTIHNQRRDNMTVANTRVWRVSPMSKLNEGYEIYPSAMLPAEKDEIEPLMHGEVSEITIAEEQLTLELAERRTGVSPPMQGYGAATQGKRGVYSAAGTMSLLQEGNRRTDLNIADMRYAHLRVGRILSRQYAFFGLDERKLAFFGNQAEGIMHAAELVKSGKLGLAVTSSTASVNKEIEKQNDMLLVQVMSRHYSMIAQLIQAVTSSVTPPAVKDYLTQVIGASDKLMKSIIRNFDRDDADALVPKVGQNGAGQAVRPQQQQVAGMAGAGSPGVLPFPSGMAGEGSEVAAPGVGSAEDVSGTGGA